MKKLLVSLLAGMLFAGSAFAQTQPLPQVTAIGSNDLIQDIVNGSPAAGNVYVPAPLLGTYSQTLSGGNPENALIGGDFTTNLFQRSTTSGTVTGTFTYTADRWFLWSGTSTNLVSTQQTGAADIPQDFGASLRITRSSTGIIQSCAAQVVSTANSYRFQGQTAEFDFHALAGSGFSAASSDLAVYIAYGTGADEGAQKFAHTINLGGGGSTSWAGGTVLGGATGYLIPISATWSRYSVVAPIPATATEIGVAICWTPVGTSPTNDYMEFTGAQLVPNNSLTGVAGSAGVVLGVNDTRAKSFLRRPAPVEAVLQQAYFYEESEAGTSAGIFGECQGTATSTVANCLINFPVPMRAVPTISYTAGGIKANVGTSGAAEAVSALTITASGATINSAALTATSSSVASGTFGFLVATGSTGVIAFSAEE